MAITVDELENFFLTINAPYLWLFCLHMDFLSGLFGFGKHLNEYVMSVRVG